MGTPSARTEPSGPKSRKRQGELTFRFRKVKRGTGELGEGKPGRDRRRRGRRWRSGRRSCAWPSSPSRRSDTTVRDPIHRLRLAWLMLVCSGVVLGALHYGEIRALFFVRKELGVAGLRSGAVASVFGLLASSLNSNLPAAAEIFFGGFFRAGAKIL